ncbi:hypothetical protein FMM80_17420 [Schaedlerella arabinosiphila]|uniref:Uncharacterized protein n=1 Tax=Schaedlerella arabinosiphila TaxID=2044587 RepID=A0A9X5C911_9FIRM|nr:hypothetical protein [Schaedlerella arabinosiphila]NDO70324.1 hypothetical protein [Schaedlerella arabinosiphila]
MDKNTEAHLKKAAKELAEKTGKAADIAKDTIASQMENENVKNATQTAAKAAKESKEKFTKHGKRFAQDVLELKDGARTEKNYKTAFKMILLMCAVALTSLFIHEMIGFDMVFEICALIALAVLIYKAVKKKPKKNAAVALIAFTVLSGIFGAMTGSGRVPDNVLDYIGTKDRAAYKTYDKSDFCDDGFGVGTLVNEKNNHSGLPHISIANGKVDSITLVSGMNTSFNVGGLHIGDNVNQVETCMEKLNADISASTQYNTEYASGLAEYDFQYRGKNMHAMIGINTGIVDRIHVFQRSR